MRNSTTTATGCSDRLEWTGTDKRLLSASRESEGWMLGTRTRTVQSTTSTSCWSRWYGWRGIPREWAAYGGSRGGVVSRPMEPGHETTTSTRLGQGSSASPEPVQAAVAFGPDGSPAGGQRVPQSGAGSAASAGGCPCGDASGGIAPGLALADRVLACASDSAAAFTLGLWTVNPGSWIPRTGIWVVPVPVPLTGAALRRVP